MPLYEYRCCEKNFEVMLPIKDYGKKVTCPYCNSDENVVKLLSKVSVQFAQPQESSKFDNFEYRAAHNLEKAKDQRRHAQAKSHVGPNPYSEVNDIETKGEGIFDA